ncbi:MAG: hypothetical protein JNM00_10290 [Flavobacteriales bacterium]|nr:hypothetical protein [Flavobacteriales bacterium]
MIRTLLFLSVFISVRAFGQLTRDTTWFDPHISVSFAYQAPGGDLAFRFMNNMSLGGAFQIRTPANWYYGIEGTYFFGNKVNEPGLMQNLYTDAGEILDNSGQVAIVAPQERGFTVMANGGRLFPVVGPNDYSGILVRVGAGFMRHKIRLEHQESEITQLEGDYAKGYDRLTYGPAISQHIGYMHASNNRLINFYIGVEAFEGFTKGRRALNFDTRTTDNAQRFDMLVGLRAGWILHLTPRTQSDYYFN